MIDLTLLNTFVTVAKTRNISRAAEQIHLTQPAVSLQIKQLESIVGSDLFLRHPLRLTDAGEHLLVQAESMLAQWQDVLTFTQDESSLNKGTLTIACSDTVMRFCLLPLIKTFRQQYPGIELSLLNRTSRSAKDAVLNGEADLAYALFDQSHPKLRHQAFLTYQEQAAFPKRHPWSNKTSIAAEQLSSQPLLLLEERTQSRQWLNQWFLDKGCRLEQAMSLGSVDAQIALAKAGLGVAILPDFAIPKALQHSAIKGLPPRTVSLYYQRLKPAAKVWVELANEQ